MGKIKWTNVGNKWKSAWEKDNILSNNRLLGRNTGKKKEKINVVKTKITDLNEKTVIKLKEDQCNRNLWKKYNLVERDWYRRLAVLPYNDDFIST